jgi:ABC-type transport system involved in cytochrome c biogenesis permease component
MIVIALIACLLALSDFISGKYSSGAIKLVTSGYALFLASVNKCVSHCALSIVSL